MIELNKAALTNELINLCDQCNYAQGISDKSFHKYYCETDPKKVMEYEHEYEQNYDIYEMWYAKITAIKQLFKRVFDINIVLNTDCYGYITMLTIEIFNNEFDVIKCPINIPLWITQFHNSLRTQTIEKYFNHEIRINDEITNGGY